MYVLQSWAVHSWRGDYCPESGKAMSISVMIFELLLISSDFGELLPPPQSMRGKGVIKAALARWLKFELLK